MVSWQLIFPRSMDEKALIAFLGSLHGLARSRLLVLDRPAVIFEVDATAGQIRHRLLVADAYADVVEGAVRSTLPGVRLEDDEADVGPTFSVAIELSTSTNFRPLRMDQLVASASTVLAALQPVRKQETLRLQWVLAPAPSPRPPRLAPRNVRHPDPWWVDSHGLPDSELVRAQRQKQQQPLFLSLGRIAVAGAEHRRARYLIQRTFSAIRRAEAPGVRLRRRPLPFALVASRAKHRTVPALLWPLTVNAAELAGVLGIPLGGPSLPGLTTGTARQLPLPPDASRTGITIATSTYPGEERPLRMPLEMRRQHSLILGPTGSGKSNLIASMALQDIAGGRGLVLLDPKGDLVEDITARMPRDRFNDVIVLDATDIEAPIGLNPIGLTSSDEGQRELAVDQVVGTMHNLFRDSWGIRTADVLRATLSTLVATKAADGSAWTLADIPAVLANDRLRQRLARQVNDPVIQSFWAWYERLSDPQRIEVTAPLLNKLRTILLRPRLRRVLGQSQGLDLFQVIQQRKILLVPLPKGQLGEDAAGLLGSLVVAQLWSAVMARTVMPSDRRSVFMAYIDEAKDFLKLPVAVGDMLAEARGLGLGVHLATQHLSQFPKELRDGTLANARTKLVFRTTHDDAKILSRFVEPTLTIDDLKGLPTYELVLHSDAAGHVMTATGKTDVLSRAIGHSPYVRELSRSQWGTPLEDIDTALARRQELGGGGNEEGGRRLGPRRRDDGEAA